MKCDFICEDCGADTWNAPTTDLYMVIDELWTKFGNGKGVLCRKCLEIRIGRKLEKSDFIDCKLNKKYNLI